jgi:GNAT superfamily N-acetyltransferase
LDDEEESIVGFFSLSASRAKLDKRYKSSHAIMTSSKISEYPSIDLTFFAVNRKYQGQGYGAAMMDLVFEQVDKISHELGVTVLSLESLDRAVGFYLSRGFETYGLRSGGMRDQVPMSITIYEIQSLLSGA